MLSPLGHPPIHTPDTPYKLLFFCLLSVWSSLGLCWWVWSGLVWSFSEWINKREEEEEEKRKESHVGFVRQTDRQIRVCFALRQLCMLSLSQRVPSLLVYTLCMLPRPPISTLGPNNKADVGLLSEFKKFTGILRWHLHKCTTESCFIILCITFSFLIYIMKGNKNFGVLSYVIVATRRWTYMVHALPQIDHIVS